MADYEANQLLKLDEGTYLKDGGSIRTWEYYSRYIVAADTTTARIFTQQQGGSSLFNRLDQTNMPAPGRIPNSQRFDILAVAVAYKGGAAKSDANIIAVCSWLYTTVLEFWITDKTVMFQKRLSSVLGASLFLFNDPTTAAEPVGFTLRVDLSKTFNLKRKISLASNTDFWAQIVPGVAAAAQQVSDGDFVDVGLHGDLWARV